VAASPSSLLRARVSANEAAAIGALRTMVSAQAAYSSAHGGNSDRLECLVEPARCIPGTTDTAYLEPTFLQAERRGYRFRFAAGTPVKAEEDQAGQTSTPRLDAWTYIAEPMVANQTGVRAFCTQSSGEICFSRDGRIGETTDGLCPDTCEPID
jgi:hypothetical protein